MSLLLVHIVVLMAVMVANGSAQPQNQQVNPNQRFQQIQQFNTNQRVFPNQGILQDNQQFRPTQLQIQQQFPRQTTPSPPPPPLVLHTTTDLKMIWNNKGSAANYSVSIWRAEPQGVPHSVYPVGDIVVKSLTDHPSAYVVEMPEARLPDSYTKIWNNQGSRAVEHVTIWGVNCPQGYEALGNVATNGKEPSNGSIYCVNNQYLLTGSKTGWSQVWNNTGSHAHTDVAIYTPVPTTANQQKVFGVGAIASDTGFPGTPYFLNKNDIKKPVPQIDADEPQE